MSHSLDPLTEDEFRAIASILQREHGVGEAAGGLVTSNFGWRFASIELAEPGKSELRVFDDGGPLKPFGFFDRNPALDVVATPPDMCHTPSTSAYH